MKIDVVDVCCPKCKSEKRETIAFGSYDFRYQCEDCSCKYEVHFEKVPVSIGIYNETTPRPVAVEELLNEFEANNYR